MMLYKLTQEYNWDYSANPAMLLPSPAAIEWLRTMSAGRIHNHDFVVWANDYESYMSVSRSRPSNFIGSMYGAAVAMSQAFLKVLHTSGIYTTEQDYYQLCANLNALAPELEDTFVHYLSVHHSSVLSELGDFKVQAVGSYVPPLVFRTVIALANASDVTKVSAYFADYLSLDVLVIGKGELAELVECNRIAGFGCMHGMALDDGSVIYDNSFDGTVGRASRHYAKGFVSSNRMVLDDVDVDLPFNFAPLAWCEDNFIPLIDEDEDEVDYSSISFSYSCGYYDRDLKTVHNYALYDADDVVTLHSGWTWLRDDACYVESRDDWFKADECVYSEYAEAYLVRWGATEFDGEWYPDDADCIVRCDECGHRMHEDSDEVYHGDWRVLCEGCSDSDDGGGSLYRFGYNTNVLDYSKMLTPHLQINGKGVYTGIELETYCDYDEHEDLNVLMRDHMQQSRNDVKYVPTEDGSLDDDCGVEFIFKPMSLDDMRSEMERFCEIEGEFLNQRQRNGYGLHVHVSSHFLTNLDKVRIQNFVDTHEAFCREIGGRDETDYQRSKSSKRNIKKTELCTDRYSMVNTLPSATIEYRFPCSMPEQQHIMANVELCMAITMYVKYNSSSATQDDASRFYDYILNNYKTYPVLAKRVPLSAQQGNAVYQEYLAKANRKATFQSNQSN